MFNRFKKAASTVKAELDVSTILAKDPITHLSISESEAFRKQGNAHLYNGKLEDAAACFRQAIGRSPNYAEAYTNLGLVFQIQGNMNEAVAHFRKAVELKPSLLPAHLNLGICLMNLGQTDAADESLRRVIALASEQRATPPQHAAALQTLGVIAAQRGDFHKAEPLLCRALDLQPDDIDTHNYLGNLFLQTNRLDEAEASYRRALELQQDSAIVHYNLGNLLVEAKRLPEAEASFRRALELKPDYAEANNNLGSLLQQTNRLSEAEASFRRALQLKPDYFDAHINLGNLLQQTMRLPEAEVSYRRSIELKPDCAEAHIFLGNMFIEAERLFEAEASYRRALELKPDFAEAYSNLGNALKGQYRLNEAEACYHQAIQIKPNYAVGHNNFGLTLTYLGRLEEAEASYRRALRIKPDFAEAHSNLLFALNFDPDLSKEEIFRASQEYEAQIGLPLRSTWRTHSNDKNPNRRLRVGYVSPDFRNHPVAYFAEPILANHDKSRVKIFCYAEVRREDELTGRFQQLADHWHSTVGLSDDAVAQMIRDHQIDILVDLAGHTAKNRLQVFARKPAPIQMTYLGYPGTTGLSAMDYRITDHFADPEGIADTRYTERLLRLPDSLCCYRPSHGMPTTSPLPALVRGYLTFGSFNNFNKIDQPTLDLWAELLRALPTSRLMILTVPEGDARQRLLHSFAERGISAQRLELHGKLPAAEFHRKFLEVDITLDTVNVSGGTTTCESLWMGVPVIALVGERFITRVSYSFLSTAGLTDFAAFSPKDYIRIAARFADNLTLLAEIRIGLRERMTKSPLTDEKRFALAVENVYREIWQTFVSESST